MRKNYLKPLCKKVPIRGSRLMEGSLRIYNDKVDTNDEDNFIGGARENQAGNRSVWDD